MANSRAPLALTPFLRHIPLQRVASSLTLTIFTALFAIGCQSTKPQSINFPPPTFSGPTIAQKPVVAQAPTPPNHSNTPPPLAAAPTGPKDWTPSAPARPWRWIVIHHSASPSGSMAIFDKEHKAKGWDGVGYHFVIGNGTNSGDGQIEVTPRWPIQKWGAHAKTPDNRFNEYGIGICLVGNFDIERPSPAQLRSLSRLVAFLSHTYRIAPANVIGHGETKATHCPGRYVNVPAIRQMASADADAEHLNFDLLTTPTADPAPVETASVELLHDSTP